MSVLTEWKHGLEHAWDSFADGWREMRERAANAVTRYRPSAAAQAQPGGKDELPPMPLSAGWGLLAADVYDTDDQVIVRLEAPGMKKDDFRIEVQGDALVIEGDKRYECETTEGRYRLMQCAYGSFSRTVPLPVPVHSERAKASYADGVLRVELPKREEAKPRRIAVKG
ncbi:MAG: Hsp20/alpha crystallin family protein [Pseudomonadota bacterium]